ncbi:sigma-54-dependent Fis family transcriptional regulator [Neptunomonas sp.]|uniref:sigma-54-dependent Fis family transcriptional regulator n=2 Tax=Oceanospirillaceae TaxID=135620 RepID=UPI00351900B0
MPTRLDLIRKDFTQRRAIASDILDKDIYQSWERCAEKSLPMTGRVDYKHLSAQSLNSLLEDHRLLLHSAKRNLDNLYNTMAGAGWSVLLTDNNCTALKVYKSKNIAEKKIMQAFTPGAVLSEEMIGTSAMSCALQASRLISVYGQEHYKEAHRNFNCVAVPIFDQYNTICGTVDLTNENPVRDPAAFYVLEQCAKNIQRDLIYSIPDAIIIELSSDYEHTSHHQKVILVLSYDQQVIGANSVGSHFFNLDLNHRRVGFSDLFFDDFSVLFDQGLLKDTTFKMTMNNGVSLYAHVNDQHSHCSPSKLTHVSHPLSQSDTVIEDEQEITSFGEPAVHQQLKKCIKAIGRLPVLVLGESGVGKEIAARQIHELSPNKRGKFIAVNCAAIPDALIESELFGYLGGAFTGANKTGAKGKVEEADGGTLFLDEIGDMPIALQTRLLRVLETKEVNRLGSNKVQKINFQLICATHQHLENAVSKGDFRQDLYYRINGVTLTIPPLRQRSNVLELAQKIMDQVSIEPRRFSSCLMDFINQYSWPGNVRELKSALVYADTLAESTLLTVDDLPETLSSSNLTRDDDSPNPFQASHLSQNYNRTLNSTYDQLIRKTMEASDGDVTQAAKAMGISRATLYRKLAAMKGRTG